ncbi:TPA: hypothetical protein SMF76_002357 [Serratia marcescens]|nr:hypothetical protein [Serratia marcescens]
MMSKLGLVALVMCAASTTAQAASKSYGTASASVVVNPMQEWKIEKVQDGNLYLNGDGRLTKFQKDAIRAKFKVTNRTPTASKYWITGSGVSYGDGGKIFVTNDSDPTKTFEVVPVNANLANFALDSESNRYVSMGEVSAGSSDEFSFDLARTSEAVVREAILSRLNSLLPRYNRLNLVMCHR